MSATVSSRFTASFGDAAAAVRTGDRRRMIVIALQQALFGVVVVTLLGTVLEHELHAPSVALDFTKVYWTTAHRLLAGDAPYGLGRAQVASGSAFVYPALSALVFVPFTLLGRGTSADLFTFVCVALTPVTLWLLNVRDWRVYSVAMLWLPVYIGWETGNETLPLIVMMALMWRYRERAVVAGLMVGIAISLKLFAWPLGLWLLATRRWRAAGWALGSGLVLNLAAWTVVGFSQFAVFVRECGLVSKFAWRGGYAIPTLFGHLGMSRGFGDGVMVVAALGLCAAVVYVGLIRRDELGALTLVTALMLVSSPLVWSHYFAVLMVPLALRHRRLHWLWALPLLMWVSPNSPDVGLWQVGVFWAATGLMLFRLAPSLRARRA